MKPWLQTYSGGVFFPTEPRAEDVDIQDIAHALSQQCRFSGHSRVFYSVAEHSVRASGLVNKKELALAVLMHDAAEAYCVDLPTPIKHWPRMAAYRALERRVERVIGQVFDIDFASGEVRMAIEYADGTMLATEAAELMNADPKAWGLKYPRVAGSIRPWTSEVAKKLFLNRFRELA